ncbi:hypothetical protein ASL14_23945 [Paenibacillus sp. IHB B 3084]|uniref:hypothetical protein n=1 Tax=Paenibacillus sp. IHB B 3084 TaxID=867076 RepID=UPI0007217A92|nr:hypothetical protein [Paenibacillus sp. IHB B 3084]ALP38760.1 hypothetical protein ASL14_23945 [Paenibacillus sp. IHB B 3084]
MDPSIASSPSAVVAADGSGDYLSLIEALASNETNILIKNGIYNVSTTILIQNHTTKYRVNPLNKRYFAKPILQRI